VFFLNKQKTTYKIESNHSRKRPVFQTTKCSVPNQITIVFLLLLLLQPFAKIPSRPSISLYHYIPEDLYYQMNVKITFVCSLYRIHDSPIHACTVNHLEMRVFKNIYNIKKITIVGTSRKQPPLVSDRDHF